MLSSSDCIKYAVHKDMIVYYNKNMTIINHRLFTIYKLSVTYLLTLRKSYVCNNYGSENIHDG